MKRNKHNDGIPDGDDDDDDDKDDDADDEEEEDADDDKDGEHVNEHHDDGGEDNCDVWKERSSKVRHVISKRTIPSKSKFFKNRINIHETVHSFRSN